MLVKLLWHNEERISRLFGTSGLLQSLQWSETRLEAENSVQFPTWRQRPNHLNHCHCLPWSTLAGSISGMKPRRGYQLNQLHFTINFQSLSCPLLSSVGGLSELFGLQTTGLLIQNCRSKYQRDLSISQRRLKNTPSDVLFDNIACFIQKSPIQKRMYILSQRRHVSLKDSTPY